MSDQAMRTLLLGSVLAALLSLGSSQSTLPGLTQISSGGAGIVNFANAAPTVGNDQTQFLTKFNAAGPIFVSQLITGNALVPSPNALPQSSRIIHKGWDGSVVQRFVPAGQTATAAATGAAQIPLRNPALAVAGLAVDSRGFSADRYLRIRFEPNQLAAGVGGQTTVATVAPRLRVRLVNAQLTTPTNVVCNTATFEIGANNIRVDPNDNTRTITVELPVFNYYEHAPEPNDTPVKAATSYQRICISVDNGATYQDYNLYLGVHQPCFEGMLSSDLAIYDAGANYRCNTRSRSTPTPPVGRYLTVAANVFTLSADNANTVGPIFQTTTAGGALGTPSLLFDADGWEANADLQNRNRRLTCCGSRGAIQVIQNGVTINLQPEAGVCIDNSATVQNTRCCGQKPYDATNERCCSRASSRVMFRDDACPCTSTNDCIGQGANTLLGVNVQGRDNMGLGTATVGAQCCSMTKYPELVGATRQFANEQVALSSTCFGGPDANLQCCDDGNVYDPGTAQCCPVNGVQSLNVPCPCHDNTHCRSGHRCCRQLFPPINPILENSVQCNKYQNYPVGRGAVTAQRCYGQCYDSTFQMCCNGALCNNNFETCCNSTCCNKFTSACTESFVAPGNANNYLNYGVWYERCTTVEALTTRRAFFIFILPVMLLFATLLSLALVTMLARRMTEHIFQLTEKFLCIVAVLAVLVSLPLFFTPVYKYGIVTAFASIFAILAAVARKKRFSFVVILLVLIAVLLLIDPFAGNPFLGFGGNAPQPQFSGRVSSTIVDAIVRLMPEKLAGNGAAGTAAYVPTMAAYNTECVNYYDFFAFDTALRDTRKFNANTPTYGYCSRAWLVACLIFAALLILFMLLLLLLAIFSFVKLLGFKAPPIPAPVELDIVME